jgi:cholesterol oxidase
VPKNPLRFVVASCQYPPGLFDKVVAGDSWRRLRGDLAPAAPAGGGDTAPGDLDIDDPDALSEVIADRTLAARVNENLDAVPGPAPGFALLLGDQVYVDATANVFDVPGADPVVRAARAYDLNWRLRPLREVRARLPVYTMLDDHEVADDWQPPGPDAQPPTQDAAALQAWQDHQAKLNPPSLEDGAGRVTTASYTMAPGGWPFFVFDTRRCRERRTLVQEAGGTLVEDAAIVPAATLQALADWLARTAAVPVRFIASPSTVLPPEQRDSASPECVRLDSWSGYPASLCALLRLCDRDEAQGVVLLCGNAHLSLVSRFVFGSGRVLHVVVASGLYAPWPFSNTCLQDLRLDGPVVLGDGSVTGTMHTLASMTCAGHAIIGVVPPSGGAACRVQVALHPHDGAAPTVREFEPGVA